MSEVAVEPITVTHPAPEPATPASHAPARGRRLPAFLTHPIALLLLLTLIGGVMRFAFLDKPPIWFDEAATYARTCATYVELLESLEEAGFGPLHYSTYWWIKNGLPMWGKIETIELPAVMRGNEFGRTRTGPRTKGGLVQTKDLKPSHQLIKSGSVTMTPFMMRLIPALCGTLMIPAMYWLAREMSGRRSVALVAALLTTFSAYLLNYSRDAKMYMDFWLFVTLHVAALLWWLRTRTMIAWWCWIIAGTAMIGLHLLGAIVLAIDLIIVLTARKPFWRYHLPVLYTPVAMVAVPAEWIGRTTWKLAYAREVAPAQPSLTLRLFERFWRGFHVPALFGFIVGVCILSIGPYGYYKVFNKYAQRITERGWMGSGLQWISDYNEGRTPGDHVKFAVSAFMTGWEWPRRTTDLLMLKDGSSIEGKVARAFKKWKVTKADGTTLEIPDDQVAGREEGQLDEKLTKSSTLKFLKRGCIAMAAILLLAVFPWRWPWRKIAHPVDEPDQFTVAHGWRRMLYIALWIVLPPFGVYLVSQPAGSIPKLPSDGFNAALRATSAVRWSTDAIHLIKLRPYVAGTIGVIVIAGFVLCARTWRARFRQAGALIAIALISILICATFRDVYPYFDAYMLKAGGRGWKNHQPMWMPRYLGLIIPALFVFVAILILRLPSRYGRALAILIFVVINMYQFGGRVFAGTEPPVDRMVADTLEWRKSMDTDGAVKMYYNVRRPNLQAGLGPGTGVLGMPTARYYWAIYTGSPSHPDEIRGFGSPVDSRFPSFTSSANSIKNEVTKNPKLNKLIVWDSIDSTSGSTDRTLAALGESWQKVGNDEIFYARDHWTWRDLMTIRRRVYMKNPNAPTTAPAAAPATNPTTAPIPAK